jgi:hypothetical protein
MASSQDYLQGASLHGLKPGFPPSYNYSWPQKNFLSSSKSSKPKAMISSKLQVFMASNQTFL